MSKKDVMREALAGLGLGTDAPPEDSHNMATAEPQPGHARATLHPVHVRLIAADYEALGRIAAGEGTTRAALVRRAIRELIRKART